ncbi:hypothetical protein ACFQX7_21650 [Luedemannella flava]
MALATGDLKPGARGWRVAQARLTRIQLTMNRHDGPPLLERIRVERLEMWALHGGQARRALAGAALGQVASVPGVPSDVAERMEPMQWLLELANGRQGDAPGVPLTVAGNLARRVVQEAAERFNWWDLPERLPRSESDMWRLTVLRTVLSSAGAVRRVGRKLLLGTRGRALLGNPLAQWQVATDHLLADAGFDAAAQEAALLLLLQAGGMVEMRELVTEVADVLAGSGWRDTGDGSPPTTRTSAARCGRSCAGASCGHWWTPVAGRAGRPACACRPPENSGVRRTAAPGVASARGVRRGLTAPRLSALVAASGQGNADDDGDERDASDGRQNDDDRAGTVA